MMIKGAVAPVCFDGGEFEFAEFIVDAHAEVVRERGFDPTTDRARLVNDVCTPVNSSFCTIYGQSPANRFADIFDQVAHFASHLAKDHIFPDGNKRTTVKIVLAVLSRAGVEFDMPDYDDPESNVVYMWVQSVVAGDGSQEALANELRQAARPAN